MLSQKIQDLGGHVVTETHPMSFYAEELRVGNYGTCQTQKCELCVRHNHGPIVLGVTIEVAGHELLEAKSLAYAVNSGFRSIFAAFLDTQCEIVKQRSPEKDGLALDIDHIKMRRDEEKKGVCSQVALEKPSA